MFKALFLCIFMLAGKVEAARSGLFSNTTDVARKDACLRDWPRLPSGYFVLNAEESCTIFAQIHPNETEQACIEALIGNRARNRDYYLNAKGAAQLCDANPVMNADQQTCAKNKISTGGDLIRQFNLCDEGLKACVKRLQKIVPAGTTQIKKLYEDFCFSYPQDEAMGSCVANLIKKQRALAGVPDVLNNLCYEYSRTCSEYLEQVVGSKKPTLEKYRTIANICYRARNGAQTQSWTRCVLEELGRSHANMDQATKICSIDNQVAKACVVDLVVENVPVNTAIESCRIQNSNARSCMIAFHKHLSPFHTGLLRRLNTAQAGIYCAIETESERVCMNTELARISLDDSTDFNILSKQCRESSPVYERCLFDFNEYFEIGWALNVSIEDGRNICALPSPEMRLCMLNGIMGRSYVKPGGIFTTERTRFPYDEYYQKCLSQYLGFLLGEMQTPELWQCRFQYFTNLSIWDKGWYCATASEKRLCREFHAEIRAMNITELAPHCGQFRQNYHRDENSYGNPLWHLCRDNNLITR